MEGGKETAGHEKKNKKAESKAEKSSTARYVWIEREGGEDLQQGES